MIVVAIIVGFIAGALVGAAWAEAGVIRSFGGVEEYEIAHIEMRARRRKRAAIRKLEQVVVDTTAEMAQAASKQLPAALPRPRTPVS